MKKGAIKVSVLYPSGEGKTFDMIYYCKKHVPMVSELLGNAVIGATVEEGLAGGLPDSEPTYHVMGNLYFESVEAYQNSLGPNAEKIMGDIPNFTNIEPVIQISRVII
ncbi:EthD family reductase [Mangrovibacterium lignilyticum]|uniref:EthD family reductase n=1 Tax=Mangrovibacterium lignilyticum TaxID=2668052 RepID=UPI0013D76DE8|nr:EthD family reductase [Mangrovibacterium lignilyticum]